MIKIEHLQYRTILETDFFSRIKEKMRFAFSQKFSNIFSPKLEKPGIHSLPTGRIMEIYVARNERKLHVNFGHNGRKSCLHISEAERGTLSWPPDGVATVYNID